MNKGLALVVGGVAAVLVSIWCGSYFGNHCEPWQSHPILLTSLIFDGIGIILVAVGVHTNINSPEAKP